MTGLLPSKSRKDVPIYRGTSLGAPYNLPFLQCDVGVGTAAGSDNQPLLMEANTLHLVNEAPCREPTPCRYSRLPVLSPDFEKNTRTFATRCCVSDWLAPLPVTPG